MKSNSESEDLVGEESLTTEEAEELSEVLQDLYGLVLSVKVESAAPVRGLPARIAGRIRVAIGEPDCRIQVCDDDKDAVLGPLRWDADDPLGALWCAMTALGGSWGEVVTTTTSAGPAHYAGRAALESADEGGAARIHLWVASTWALTNYIEGQTAARRPS